MANQVMNFARGKIGYYMADALGLNPANSRMTIVVLEVAQADDTLNNHDELGALIAAANTEATATNLNSTRDETDDTGITANTPDDTGNTHKAVKDADVTWTSVSGTAAVKLLCCYDADNAAGTDTDIVVLTHHDFAVTPNGGDITADFDQTNGFWASS